MSLDFLSLASKREGQAEMESISETKCIHFVAEFILGSMSNVRNIDHYLYEKCSTSKSFTNDCLHCVIYWNHCRTITACICVTVEWQLRSWFAVNWSNALDFVNTKTMSVGKTERATMAKRRWDLSTIFGVPKLCLQPQFPRNFCKGSLGVYVVVCDWGEIFVAKICSEWLELKRAEILYKLQHRDFLSQL